MDKTVSPRQVLSPNKASRANNGYIYSYSCQGYPMGTPKQPRLFAKSIGCSPQTDGK